MKPFLSRFRIGPFRFTRSETFSERTLDDFMPKIFCQNCLTYCAQSICLPNNIQTAIVFSKTYKNTISDLSCFLYIYTNIYIYIYTCPLYIYLFIFIYIYIYRYIYKGIKITRSTTLFYDNIANLFFGKHISSRHVDLEEHSAHCVTLLYNHNLINSD